MMTFNYFFVAIFWLLNLSAGQYFQSAPSCKTTKDCEEIYVNGICQNLQCRCKPDHYLGQDINNNTLCIPCPSLGEYCGIVQCCRQSSYMICTGGFCHCQNSYDGIYCWNANSVETVQFESIAQIILGLALIFTIAVLGSLVWRLCSRAEDNRRGQVNLNRDTSFASLNSIQQLVLIRLQDRPPPYNPNYLPWKHTANQTTTNSNTNQQLNQITPPEAPPPYTITLSSQVPLVLSQTGTDNPVYNSEHCTPCSSLSSVINLHTNENPANIKPRN